MFRKTPRKLRNGMFKFIYFLWCCFVIDANQEDLHGDWNGCSGRTRWGSWSHLLGEGKDKHFTLLRMSSGCCPILVVTVLFHDGLRTLWTTIFCFCFWIAFFFLIISWLVVVKVAVWGLVEVLNVRLWDDLVVSWSVFFFFFLCYWGNFSMESFYKHK